MISVIIPVFNVEKYLTACVRSLLAQRFSDWELILVDDGSEDGSGRICDEFTASDDRIRVIHRKNGGAGAARNAGLRAARGELITFIDSDDVVLPDYLETLYGKLMDHQAEVSCCRFQKIKLDEDMTAAENTGKIELVNGREAAKRITADHQTFMIMPMMKLFRKELLEGQFFPEGKIHEDEFFCYRVLYPAEKVVIADYRGYGYRQRKGSITASFSEKNLDRFAALKEACAFYKDKNDRELMAYAEKRYLMEFPISFHKIRTGMKLSEKKKQLMEHLRREEKQVFREVKKEAWPLMTAAERMMVSLFHVSPVCCSILTGLYVKMFGSD